MTKRKKILIQLSRIFGALTGILVLVIVFFVLIIGQPQTTAKTSLSTDITASNQAVQNASLDETDLSSLMKAFPSSVMSFMSGSNMSFVSGNLSSQKLSTGTASVLTLYWQTSSGEPLILQSIYPAGATELLTKNQYHFSSQNGPTLLGQSSVRMENDETIRIHTANDKGLYLLTLPVDFSESISALVKSLQLF